MNIKFYFSIDCGMIFFKSDGMEIFDIKGEFEGYLGFLYRRNVFKFYKTRKVE